MIRHTSIGIRPLPGPLRRRRLRRRWIAEMLSTLRSQWTSSDRIIRIARLSSKKGEIRMSDSLGFGIFSLQSGFVVAVLIGGLLLAERLGGDEGFARKATLAAVAIALALLVTSGTTAFLWPPDVPEDVNFFSNSSSQSDQAQAELLDYSKASTHRASDAGSIHVGIGILLALTGGLFIRRWRALGLGILLGGVLLLLLGAVPSTESLYSSIYSVRDRFCRSTARHRSLRCASGRDPGVVAVHLLAMGPCAGLRSGEASL